MDISQNGIDLIKEFEGCYLTSYKCPAGVWTIGYGTTEPIDGKPIKQGMTITQAQADALLIKNLATYEKAVNTYVTYKINQNMYDALVSFTYNCGTGALKKSSLLEYLNKGEVQKAADQFLLWNKATVNGVLQPLKGLTRRREAERKLFLKEVPAIKPQEDPLLADAVSKIILSGTNINFNAWKRLDLINLNNVPALLTKLGGIDKLIDTKVIGSVDTWRSGEYTVDNVRSLLIKYASKLG